MAKVKNRQVQYFSTNNLPSYNGGSCSKVFTENGVDFTNTEIAGVIFLSLELSDKNSNHFQFIMRSTLLICFDLFS